MDLDVLIFGGGAAGLWLLDHLARRGERVLLMEAGRLGQGQTIASQGIIHGGLKYTLQGLLTSAAREIRDMPGMWRQCLAGAGAPDLRRTGMRAEACHLWRSDSLRSRLGMLGARVGLQVAPCELSAKDRPGVFAGCPGPVSRIDEQVIDPVSFVADLARQHHERLLKIEAGRGVNFVLSGPGVVDSVVALHPENAQARQFRPRQIVLTAGAGNAALRRLCGLAAEDMQRRPLHMVLARGNLPVVNGHCVDGARTRVTITTGCDARGATVWQVGGQLAEDGVCLDEQAIIRRARAEIAAVLPGVDVSSCEWSTYRVERAERAMPRGGRPDAATVLCEGNVITAWPTKLALVPQLARMVETHLEPPQQVGDGSGVFDLSEIAGWPRPEVALPPWRRRANGAVSIAIRAPAMPPEWTRPMQSRPLGNTGLGVTPIGFGAFKIGRNEKTKYREHYALPDDSGVERLLNEILDLGVAYIDTAPAYGLSEERIGRSIGHRRREFTLSTKVGETFDAGESRYDFSAAGVQSSVERSLRRLGTEMLDLVFIHSNGDDVRIQRSTDAVETLRDLKRQGLVRAIGLSGKTVEGAFLALEWADAIMVEYHVEDTSHAPVISAAAGRGVGVVVKKGLASGTLPPADAIGFVLGTAGVCSLVVGGLNLDHIRENVGLASAMPGDGGVLICGAGVSHPQRSRDGRITITASQNTTRAT